jgi:hemolysin activation/secretion protein
MSQGLAGRRPGFDETPLSRQGATPHFSKLTGDVRLDQPLPAQLQLALVGRAQWSPGRAQMTSEQFALEGTDAVSAFVQGSFSVDAGATLRAELSRPFAWPLGSVAASVSPYLFAAQGFGVLDNPTAQEKPSIHANAVGLGVRLLFNPAAEFESAGLNAELSRGTSNAPGLISIYRALLTLSCLY